MFPSLSATTSARCVLTGPQSSKSQWFLRTSQDSYITHNALVQQATLPSTGLTTHNNYSNTVSAILILSVRPGSALWSSTPACCILRRRATRISALPLRFPSASTALTVSGFETFGDNQFATPITLFPDLRNQEKYQFRYDLSHVAGSHALKFGVNFIHEPVLGGAFAATAEQLTIYPSNPDYLRPRIRRSFTTFLHARSAIRPPPPDPPAAPALPAPITPAGDGSFSQNVQRLGLYAQDSWRVSHHLTVNYGLRYQTTFGLFTASGQSQAANPAFATAGIVGISAKRFLMMTASNSRLGSESPTRLAAARRP